MEEEYMRTADMNDIKIIRWIDKSEAKVAIYHTDDLYSIGLNASRARLIYGLHETILFHIDWEYLI